MKRLFPMLAIAGLALLAASCFQEDLLLPPPVPEIEDIDSGILDVKVSGRHPQLFAKINFISGDPATKSGSSDYYDTGTGMSRKRGMTILTRKHSSATDC